MPRHAISVDRPLRPQLSVEPARQRAHDAGVDCRDFFVGQRALVGLVGQAVPSLEPWGWYPAEISSFGAPGRVIALSVFEWLMTGLLLATAVLLLILAFGRRKLFPRLALSYYPLMTIANIPYYASAPGDPSRPRVIAQEPPTPGFQTTTGSFSIM